MATISTKTTISKETGKSISGSSQLSMFNVLNEIETGTKILNLWKSYTIRDKVQSIVSYYDLHVVEDNDWWDNISTIYYSTPRYWWVVAIANNIVNPFEELKAGTQIKILKKNYLYQLVKEIKALSIL